MPRHSRSFGLWRNGTQPSGLPDAPGAGGPPALKFNVAANSQYVPLIFRNF